MSRRELHGKRLTMVEYLGHMNGDVMREFAEDVISGYYAGKIVYGIQTWMDSSEVTYLNVTVGS